MAWKKIEQTNSTPWNFDESGDLEAEFIVSRDAKSKKGKPITFHEFKFEKTGEVVSVLGGTVLDRILSTIENGTKVKISYLGMQEGKKGDYKNYEVSIWEDD